MSEKRELTDTRLSYSSYQTLKACEQKYYHYKIAGTPVDSDYNDEKDSLVMGKAFHSILEGLKHNQDATNEDIGPVIKMVQEASNLDEDKMALVVAMVIRFLNTKKRHPKFNELKPVAIELAIADDTFLGYIDVVYADNSGNWYIGDLKTTSRHSETLQARLEMDSQLNLYGAHSATIASQLGLDHSKFSGFLYIATNKTTTKRKAGEGLSVYVNRLANAVTTRVYVVPADNDKTHEIVTDFQKAYDRTMALRNGEKPSKNLSRCEDYFSPCPYWSKCHGHNYTERKLEMWTNEEVI